MVMDHHMQESDTSIEAVSSTMEAPHDLRVEWVQYHG